MVQYFYNDIARFENNKNARTKGVYIASIRKVLDVRKTETMRINYTVTSVYILHPNGVAERMNMPLLNTI